MGGLTRSDKNVDFLTLPTEVRLAIYRYIFQDLTVPLLCDPENGTGAGMDRELNLGRVLYARPFRKGAGSRTRTFSSSETTSDQGTSILLVCRKTHDEARGVFFQSATFELQGLSESEDSHQGSAIPNNDTRTPAIPTTTTGLATETHSSPTIPPPPPPPPPPTSQIQHLSIPHTLLTNYPPRMLQKLFQSLTEVYIQQITIPLAHNKLSRLTPDLQTLHASTALARGDSPKYDIEHAPGLRLFQTLLCAMESERQMEDIMAHYAACHGRYALVLHFVLRCRHVGLLYVPGMFPFGRDPHRHGDEEVTYTFNAGARG